MYGNPHIKSDPLDPHYQRPMARSARAVSDRPPRTWHVDGGGFGGGGSAAAAKISGGHWPGMQQILGLKG